jgi:hypothetical protein
MSKEMEEAEKRREERRYLGFCFVFGEIEKKRREPERCRVPFGMCCLVCVNLIFCFFFDTKKSIIIINHIC